MKLTAIILLGFCLHLSAKTCSQTITLSGNNLKLEKVLESIEEQTGFIALYDVHTLQNSRLISIVANQLPLATFLKEVFKNQPLIYSIENNSIIITQKKGIDIIENLSQVPPITGIVRVTDGQPLAGVNVVVKGTKKGVVTDAYGRFSIEAQRGGTLIFSSVGFNSREVKIENAESLLDVALTINDSPLDEIQIVAYSKTTKRFSTGNIGTVRAEDFAMQPLSNPLQALQGAIPGVQITQSSGLPGAKIKVSIQGPNSILNGNDPLYVIDGVPYISQLPSSTVAGSLGSNFSPQGGGSPLNFINPSDIDRIDMLKDADATSIYGSRAANGAVLITTKKGNSGKNSVQFDMQQGIMQMTRRMDLMKTQQYIAIRKEALNNDGLIPSADPYAAPPYKYSPDLTLWDTTKYTDWQDYLLGGKAYFSKYTIGTSGGSKDIQYLVSSTYQKQTTVFPGDFEDKKGSVFMNLSSTPEDRKFGFNISANYMFENTKLPVVDFSSQITRAPNTPDLILPDGSLNWGPDGAGNSTFDNPLAAKSQLFQSKSSNLISNASIQYKIFPNLIIKSNFGYSSMRLDEFSKHGPIVAYRPELRPYLQRLANYAYNSVNNWIIEPQATYAKKIGKGELNALVGSTFTQTTTNGQNIQGAGYNNDIVMEDIHAASSLRVESVVSSRYKYSAAFARINYNYNQQLIISLTGRRDGSSRFGKENRFQNFGSAGAAWIFTQLPLFQNHKFLSFGKIRGSYGTTGSDQIGDYSYFNLYTPITTDYSYQSTNATTYTNLYNPYLQWERTKKLQFGLDLTLVADRVSLMATRVLNRSDNQLMSSPIASLTGFTSVLNNFPAIIDNRSWEFGLSVKPWKRGNLNWVVSANLTIPKNELQSFPDLESILPNLPGALAIGQPIFVQHLYKFHGVDPVTGSNQYEDSKGNPVDFPSDKLIYLTAMPKYFGGLHNSLTYKNIRFDFSLYFVKQISSKWGNFQGVPGSFIGGNGNQAMELLDRWQGPGDITDIAKLSTNFLNFFPHYMKQYSDVGYEDASFIRLKNVALSYSFPKKLISRVSLENLKIYMSAQNLFTITNYSGLDPETGGNIGMPSLPPLRNITFGLSVTL